MITSLLLTAAITLSPFSQQPPTSQATVVAPQKKMPTLLRVNAVKEGINHRGYQKSAYKGRYFDPRWESVRKCIGTRESHFQYMLSDGGTYQFMASKRWPVSLAWMMKKETRKVYGKRAANKMWQVLSQHEVNQWSRYWQDFSFWRVFDHGRGKHHWDPTVAGTGCF